MNELERLKEAYKVFIEYMNDNADGDLTRIIYDYHGNTDEYWDFYHSIAGLINGKCFSIYFKKYKTFKVQIDISRAISHECLGKIKTIIKDYKDIIRVC